MNYSGAGQVRTRHRLRDDVSMHKDGQSGFSRHPLETSWKYRCLLNRSHAGSPRRKCLASIPSRSVRERFTGRAEDIPLSITGCRCAVMPCAASSETETASSRLLPRAQGRVFYHRKHATSIVYGGASPSPRINKAPTSPSTTMRINRSTRV